MDQEAERIKRYFLGTLPADAAEEIELRLMSDEEFEAIVIAVENELVEDLLDQEMSEDDARDFNENYLVTDERVKNLVTVALLRKYAKANAQTAVTIARAKTANDSILDKIRSVLAGIPAVAYAAGILMIVGAAGAYIWFGRSTASERLQTEYNALNQGDLSDIDKFRALPLITAVPGTLRGADSSIKVNADGSAFVRLALLDLKDHAIFNVSLGRGGAVLLKLDAIRAYAAGEGREIRLLIPTKLLEKGIYQITVTPASIPDSPVVYTFRVE